MSPARLVRGVVVLIIVPALHAVTYLTDQTLSAPATIADNVNVYGSLTLASPGTYSAYDWKITGAVHLLVPGIYQLVAAHQSIAIGGDMVGSASGTTNVTLSYGNSLTFLGVSTNVAQITMSQTPVGGGGITPVNLPTRIEYGLELPSPRRPTAPLMNISTRAFVQPGGVVTAGFVIGGNTTYRVLLRAVGPALTTYGVSQPLADPQLNLYQGQRVIYWNDDWSTVGNTSAIASAVGAFPLAPFSKDAAMVVTLPPGNYTVQASSTIPSDSGEVLIEVYFIDASPISGP